MMRLSLSSPWLRAVMILAVPCGVVLLAAAAWMRPLAQGQQALREGRLEDALQGFAVAEARFDRLPVAKQALPAAYAAGLANQAWVLYRLGRYDALVERAAVSPPLAPVHFWAGCALFAKADAEKEPQARLGWLGRAGDEFRKALELDPRDWDTKFNHELTQRLLAELRKEPKAPPPQLLQLLRPQPKGGRPTARRVG